MSILTPIKLKMKAKPYLSLENIWMELANKKYMERKPSTAKILEVYKISGSLGAMAKIAGIESIAKIRSVVSMTIKTKNNLVAKRLVPRLTKK